MGTRRVEPAQRTSWLVAVYGGLSVLAIAVGALRGESPLITTPLLPIGAAWLVTVSLALGGMLAVCTVLVTRILVARFAWARALHGALRPAVEGASTGRLVAMAILSGVGEELFFRGLLVPALGVVGSSLLFGVLHQVPGRARFAWAAWATAMGLALAGIFRLTGSLMGPVLAHVLVNAANLVFLRDTALPAGPRKLGGILRA